MESDMNTGYIWFAGQWKHALLVSTGTKYNHYVIITHVGVRKIRQPVGAIIKAINTTEPAIRYAIAGYRAASETHGITKAADTALTEAEEYVSNMEGEESDHLVDKP